MKRQIPLCVVSLLGLLPSGALANDLSSDVVCTPDTAARGSTVTATVTFQNFDPSSFVISKYALMQHFGGLNFSGPKNTAFASPITIPAASFTGSSTTPGTASTTISFTMPVSVLPKQLVNTGFGFWGTKGSTTKKIRDTSGCSVEAQ